ncbi:MAG: protein kinase [Planctomycetes bacterium]|nr:protein kinase [Planctomycetota bacterium]
MSPSFPPLDPPIPLSPDQADRARREAEALLRAGDAAGALQVLRPAFAREPALFLLYPVAADAAAALGLTNEAQLFRKIPVSAPDPWLFFALGMHFTRHERPELGLPFFEHVVRLNPEDEEVATRARRYVGLALQWTGRPAEASRWLEALAAAGLADGPDRADLAECLLSTGAGDRAATVLRQEAPATDLPAASVPAALPVPGHSRFEPTRVPAEPLETLDDRRPSGVLPSGLLGTSPESGGRPFGRYRLLDVLGQGGMGTVWRAWDSELRRVVALKQISGDGTPGEAQVERFLREARLAARLRHPGIVPVYDVGVHEGRRFYTAEYVVGRPLDALLRAPVPLRQALQWTKEVAEALDYAHGEGVVHRDVKPGNVLVDDAGRAHVMDFGLAKAVGVTTAGAAAGDGQAPPPAEELRLTRSGDILGTPAYMSPEQARGETNALGPPGDQFSLGATLYHLLTGRPPFPHAGLLELLTAITGNAPEPPSRLRPDLPRDVETIVLRALEKEPGRRYPSMGEFARDLGRFLEGEPIRARPEAWPSRLARRAQKRRGLLLCACGAAAVAAVLATYGFGARRRAAESDAAAALAKQAEARAAAGLRKGLLAQEVLARWARLAEPIRGMERWYYDSTLSPEERRGGAAAAWGRVDEFLRRTPQDETSQATMKALGGWARRLAGYEDEGLAWMRAASDLDPDLPYGAAMEAMACLSDLLAGQVLPLMATGVGGIELADPAQESAGTAALRRRIEGLLQRAAAPGRIWGDGLERDFRRALSGIRALQDGRYAEAEAALSDVGETAVVQVLETDLLFLRAKARFALGRYEAAGRDLAEVSKARPNQACVLFQAGQLAVATALELERTGGDPRDAYRQAARRFGEVLERRLGDIAALNNRGAVWLALGDNLSGRGEDAQQPYEQALRDFSLTAKLLPGDAVLAYNLGGALLRAADQEAARGQDPDPTFARALAELDRALELAPGLNRARDLRGYVRTRVGERCAERGGDPRGDFDRAEADLGDVLRRDPGLSAAYEHRSLLRIARAATDAARGADPSASYRLALADVDEALRRLPRHVRALDDRAKARLGLAELEALRGKDARELLLQALADLDASVRLRPDRVEAYVERVSVRVALGQAAQATGGDPRPEYAHALADADEALRRAPGLPNAANARAHAKLAMAQADAVRGADPCAWCDGVLSDTALALARSPGLFAALLFRAQALLLRADALAARGADPAADLAQVLADMEEALRRTPGNTVANRFRAFTLLRQVEAEARGGADPRPTCARALEAFDKAVRADDGDAEVHGGRGVTWRRLGDAERARGGDATAAWANAARDFSTAIQRNPNAWAVRANFGQLLEAMGRVADAVTEYETALRVQPGMPAVETLLARARATLAAAGAGAAPAGGVPGWARGAAEGSRAIREGDYARARPLYETALAAAGAAVPSDAGRRALLAEAHYNLACVYALNSDGRAGPSSARGPVPPADEAARLRELAFSHLRAAIELGYADAAQFAQDADLAPLHGDPRWQGLLPGGR